MISSGMSPFVRWTCSATGRDLVLGEAPERVLDQLEVLVEVAGAGLVGQRGQEGRVPVGGHELAGAVEGAGLDAPLGLAAVELAGQVVDGVGDEGAGDRRLDVALAAVVEHRPPGLDGGGGVGQLVGDDLVGIDAAGGLQGVDGPLDDGPRGIDGGRGSGEISRLHRRERYRRRVAPYHPAA